MAPGLTLGVLDQTPVPAGSTGIDAVGATIALARAAERLGYHRYWLAEHHNTASLAATAPEVLVGAVASATTTMRVGSGGVLLPYYSPLKVAEAFRTLHALHPGRIDLGVGRAAGTDPAAEAALLAPAGAGADRFPESLVSLLGHLAAGDGAGPSPEEVRAFPDGPGGPEVWLLGSSTHSGGGAAALGLPYAFAHFITPAYGPQLVSRYRQAFRPGLVDAPRALVAVAALCADTDAEASRQASTADLWRLGPEGAARAPILPPEDVASTRLTELQQARVAQSRAKMFVGTPERVRGGLASLAGDFGVDELLVVTVCHDPRARTRSYELLADAFGLPARP